VCGAAAEGVCRFCGRAVCQPHARTRAFLFEVWEQDGELRGLAIEDALYCGVCSPRSQPVGLGFLKGGEERP